jgi:hypothetical protein
MSKHERQHNVTTTIVSNESPIRETKRARTENSNSSPDPNWSTTLYVNTQIKEEQQTGFSSCFLTDQLLMPDNKKSLIPQQEKPE